MLRICNSKTCILSKLEFSSESSFVNYNRPVKATPVSAMQALTNIPSLNYKTEYKCLVIVQKLKGQSHNNFWNK